MRRWLAFTVVVCCAPACVRTLPDQDRRIVETAPVAKVSTDLLWTEFSADPAAAARRYHGHAIVISGPVTRVETDAAHTTVWFMQQHDHGIEARLLDDQAAEIAKTAAADQRLTLKCFCEGLQTNVVLRSCVKP